MSEPDHEGASQTFIWTIACVLFVSVAAGGVCLLAYMIMPEYESSNWLPILGFVLVCTPWIFWIVTAIYRILSRTFGFRMVIGSLYGGNSTEVAGTGGDGDVGGASKSVDDIDDVKIDVKNDGETKDISCKSRESEREMASSMA